MHGPGPFRRIRSYVRREGRLTAGQRRALEQLLPRYGVWPDAPPGDECHADAYLDLEAVFGNGRPIVLEIGFGNGESLLAQAAADPAHNFLGVEVHRPGVGHLLLELERQGLGNVRVAAVDAASFIESALAPAVMETVQIFFPDPWPKQRHHKRRLIQPPLVAELARIIRPGGSLLLATDWEDYAEHMLACLDAEPRFENQARDGRFVPRPGCRLPTRFERRGERLGHRVFDLHYRRRGGSG